MSGIQYDRELSFEAHLAGVEEVERVQCLLYSLQEVDSALAQLVNQILALPLANAMLASTYTMGTTSVSDVTSKKCERTYKFRPMRWRDTPIACMPRLPSRVLLGYDKPS